MAKYSASEIRHGPIRWLIRLCGWSCLITWVTGLFTGSEMATIYFGSSGSALMIGVVCIGLDILVGLTDPDKKNSNDAAAKTLIRNNPQLKEVEKTYQQVCKALPNEDEGALLVKLTRQYGTAQLVQQTKNDEGFCHTLFLHNPSRQMLDFIHSHNPLASYKICVEILKAAQASKTGGTAPSAGNSGNNGTNHINSFDKYIK